MIPADCMISVGRGRGTGTWDGDVGRGRGAGDDVPGPTSVEDPILAERTGQTTRPTFQLLP
jgi:hypothetical protein